VRGAYPATGGKLAGHAGQVDRRPNDRARLSGPPKKQYGQMRQRFVSMLRISKGSSVMNHKLTNFHLLYIA